MIPFFSSGDAYGTVKNSYHCKPHTIYSSLIQTPNKTPNKLPQQIHVAASVSPRQITVN